MDNRAFGGGRSLRASGTTRAIEKAFQTRLSIYHCPDQGDFRGRSGGEGYFGCQRS